MSSRTSRGEGGRCGLSWSPAVPRRWTLACPDRSSRDCTPCQGAASRTRPARQRLEVSSVCHPGLEAGHALRIASALAERLDRDGWHGADPYDGLASPFARWIPQARPRLHQAFLQCVRRSPINLRPILRIEHRRMAAATGLASTASARLASDPHWRARRDRLARMTIECQVRDGRYRGLWGYEFDVQTRWGSYGATDPNVVATSFAAHGCLDARALDEDRTTWLARGLLRNLWCNAYFAYSPGSAVLIHNANRLGAALAARGRFVAIRRGASPRVGGRLPHRLRPAQLGCDLLPGRGRRVGATSVGQGCEVLLRADVRWFEASPVRRPARRAERLQQCRNRSAGRGLGCRERLRPAHVSSAGLQVPDSAILGSAAVLQGEWKPPATGRSAELSTLGGGPRTRRTDGAGGP